MQAFDNSNLHERVYLYLKEKILKNELQPGTQIKYEQFIQELGVSRTPLRDAINQLKQQGLIEVRPRSGSYVMTPKMKDIEDLYNVRKAMECQAIETAAAKIPKEEIKRLLEEADRAEAEIKKGNVEPFFQADRRLHQTIIVHSDNRLLISIMNDLELKIKWFGVIMTKNFSRPMQANEKHKVILQSLYQNNAEQAKSQMTEHIEEIKQFILADFGGFHETLGIPEPTWTSEK